MDFNTNFDRLTDFITTFRFQKQFGISIPGRTGDTPVFHPDVASVRCAVGID